MSKIGSVYYYICKLYIYLYIYFFLNIQCILISVGLHNILIIYALEI